MPHKAMDLLQLAMVDLEAADMASKDGFERMNTLNTTHNQHSKSHRTHHHNRKGRNSTSKAPASSPTQTSWLESTPASETSIL